MTVSQIEIELPMGGLVIPNTLRASLITIQMLKDGYVPSTSTLISTGQRELPFILQIRFENVLNPIDELLTLSTWAKSAHANPFGDGSSTQDLTSTQLTSTSRLHRLRIKILSFLTSLC